MPCSCSFGRLGKRGFRRQNRAEHFHPSTYPDIGRDVIHRDAGKMSLQTHQRLEPVVFLKTGCRRTMRHSICFKKILSSLKNLRRFPNLTEMILCKCYAIGKSANLQGIFSRWDKERMLNALAATETMQFACGGSEKYSLRRKILAQDYGMMSITPQSSMGEVLEEFPGAQRALFRRYHIGGCSSCGFEATGRDACAGLHPQWQPGHG